MSVDAVARDKKLILFSVDGLSIAVSDPIPGDKRKFKFCIGFLSSPKLEVAQARVVGILVWNQIFRVYLLLARIEESGILENVIVV